MKLIKDFEHLKYTTEQLPIEVVQQRTNAYYQQLDNRRTVRDFSDKPIPQSIIEDLIMTA
jgi:iodotyrosine deiodinase